MNLTSAHVERLSARFAWLLGTTSLLIAGGAAQNSALSAEMPSDEIPENILVTGSLIRGTVAVGVPVINLSPQDFATTGTLTTSDLFRTVPQFNVSPGPVGTQGAAQERGTRVNLRQLDTGSANRSLMMIDGMRYPTQSSGLCQIDPSIIPTAAIGRIDLLLDGASATYGSDAISGVVNVILKRNFDGAMIEGGYRAGRGGNVQYLANANWGRTWDGGQITLSYSWFDIAPTRGNTISKLTFDHTPWGLDNRNPIGSSMPGTISTGGQIGQSMPDPNNPGAMIPNPRYPGNLGTNCTNCYAIPTGTGSNWNPGDGGVGPLLPGSAPTISWAALSNPANAGLGGTRNVFNPYAITDYSAGIQYTGGAITVDQRLTRDITFYGSALYGMRRSQFAVDDFGHRITYAVPTWNPYYPTGAPTNLRVAYHMGIEAPATATAYALAQRYQFGLRIALPAGWGAQLFFAHSKDQNHATRDEDASRNNVMAAQASAALGWTIAAAPPQGTAPGIGTWTKPAYIPYLNLFCDPRQFQCNSDTTLNYITGINVTHQYFHVKETGFNADGPLFDLPGGTVKMAVGGSNTNYSFLISQQVTSITSPILNTLDDPRNRQVWAGFTQLNVPIFSDRNALPLMRGLDFEASWRHDQYSDVGGTSNAKLAFNWKPIDDLVVRGGWGQSFRAPNFGEFSQVASVTWDGWNLGQVYPQQTAPATISCTGGAPPPGSGAEKLFNAGFGCGDTPGGLSIGTGGRVPADVGLRNFTNTQQKVLDPEKAVNWAIGFDYTPSNNFLTGLNIQATYYIIKINGVLRNFGNTNNIFSDATTGFTFVTPEDLRDGSTQLCPGQNDTPWLCAPFQEIVARALTHPANPVPPIAQTSIYWVHDAGTMNAGWQRNQGIDFNVSYDWDWGRLGAFNAGIVGTYYLSQKSLAIAGAPVVDMYNFNFLAPANGVNQLGVESRPRLKYRTRLGWSDGTWNVTAFMDYSQHFFNMQAAPPNVNFACIMPGGTIGGRPAYTNPCAISNYTNLMPNYITFDLSVGYNTGETPQNEYLRNLGIQVVIQNLMDKEAAYGYKINTSGGLPCACDVFQGLFGRMITLRLQKVF